MAIVRMAIGLFVSGLVAAEARHDGYIMGATGQNPKKWAVNSWWFTQYSGSQKTKALYWREHAARVWDCNGLPEGLYKDWSGVDINTKARYNYANWCDPKGSGTIPVQYRVPGAAVFMHSASAGYITHVGYLVEPVQAGKPSGDWWVIEARGVNYGVVRTKLSTRGWNRWGWMTKYFDYSASGSTNVSLSGPALGDRILKNGSEGADVREMQSGLIRLGYDLGRWGADGDFGDATELAVRAFQKANGLTVDGQFGPKSLAAFEQALAALDKPADAAPAQVRIVGGDCYVRSEGGTNGAKLGVAKRGTVLPYAGETNGDGWNKVSFDGKTGWVSGKYSEVVTA